VEHRVSLPRGLSMPRPVKAARGDLLGFAAWWESRFSRPFDPALLRTSDLQTWRLAPGEYYAEKARTAVRDNRPLRGIASALKGLAFDNENPDLYFYLGRSRVLEGDRQQSEVARASFYRAALPAFAKARELAPLDETYSLELAFTLDDLKRFTEAEWMYCEALAFDPKSEPAKSYYQTHLERWRSDGAPPKAEQPAGPPPAP
jgi:tetratricopeptide (TPR) repeat protein